MRVLITGSSGFLGTIIKNSLKENDVFELNRSSGDYHCFLENEIPKFHHTFDLVIHTAGKAHSVPKTELEKQVFYDVNVNGTIHLLKGLESSGLPNQFVFISSVSVYGLEKGELISEDVPLLAHDPYGLSKIAAEEIVEKWCRKNKIVCTILRLPLVVGKNAPGNLGAMVKAIENGFYFNIGGGKAKKSMVLAEDVGRFIPIVSVVGGVFNLTDRMHPDFATLSMAIAKSKGRKRVLNLPLILVKILGWVGDLMGNKAPINSLKIKKITYDLTFDDSRAQKMLGWSSQSVIKFIEKNSI